MSNQTNKLSRRNFLKGAAYTSALSVGAVSSVAYAACGHKNKVTASAGHSTPSVTLFNQSDKTVALNASQPVRLDKVNGWVVVKINKASDESILQLKTDEIITLTAGQKVSFPVDAEMAPMLEESGDYIVITSEFDAFNNMVPISTYDTLLA